MNQEDDNTPNSLEDIKKKISICMEDPKRSVAIAYTSYVRPYVEILGSFTDFFIETNQIFSLPPNILKVRTVLFQIFLLLDMYSSEKIPDPLPDEQFTKVLTMIKQILPLALILQETALNTFFSELDVVQGDKYPETLNKFKNLLGIALTEPKFKSEDDEQNPVQRKHYKDSNRATLHSQKEKSPLQRPISGYSVLPHHLSFINKSVHVRIRKPKHGPSSRSYPNSQQY